MHCIAFLMSSTYALHCVFIVIYANVNVICFVLCALMSSTLPIYALCFNVIYALGFNFIYASYSIHALRGLIAFMY